MVKKKKEPEREEEGVIDFGLGKISIGGLGGIFDEITSIIGAISSLEQEGVSKAGEIKGLGDKLKGVYGFTVKTMDTGEPSVEHFGHVIKKTPRGPVVEEVREPITDVFDEQEYITIIAEMPGVEEPDISTVIEGDTLVISAEKGERKYKKEVELPSGADEKSLVYTYKNGVLEIKLKRSGEPS